MPEVGAEREVSVLGEAVLVDGDADAVAAGLSSKSAKASSTFTPRSRSMIRRTRFAPTAGAASMVSASASHHAGGIICEPAAATWPILV